MVHGRWVTDIQRFAYVLAPGETEAPKSAIEKWEKGKKGSRIALAAMKPGATGYDVDKAQRAWMKEAGSLPMPWGTGHRVGYWAHDLGPTLSGAQSDRPPNPRSLRKLAPGQVFAFDGFFCWELDAKAKTTKGISVEEMAVVTEKGAEYLEPAPGRADPHSVRQMRRTMEPCGRPPRRWPSGSSRASRARGRSIGATSSTIPRD